MKFAFESRTFLSQNRCEQLEMTRLFIITVLFVSNVTAIAQYNNRWIDVPINDQSDWTFLEYVDSLSKNFEFKKYSEDLSTPINFSEIQLIDSSLQNALRPHSVRISIAVSTDYTSIAPIAISLNRGFIKYYSWGRSELKSDSIGIEPLYIVPISEYWGQLTSKQQSRLMGLSESLLKQALFDKVRSDKKKYYCLKFNELIESSLFDQAKLELIQYEIPWQVSPDHHVHMSNSEIKRITNPSDTIKHGNVEIVTSHDFQIMDSYLYPYMTLEKKELELGEHISKFFISFETELIGFEMQSPFKQTLNSFIWTNKTELTEKLESPSLLNGIDYFWAEKLERKMKK